MKTLFRWFLRIALSLILVVILFLASVTLLEIPINLTRYKEPVEILISKALKRPVSIDQSIVISTSLKPIFTLKGLRIGNPEGFSQNEYISLDLAEIRLELLPLLQRKIHISELNVKKLHITLEEKKDGNVNWLIAKDTPPTKQDKSSQKVSGKEKRTSSPELSSDTIVFSKVTLQDISLRYYGPNSPEPSLFQIKECLGTMLPGEPLKLSMDGNITASPYTLAITIASLDEFLTKDRSWMNIEAEIAKTNLLFKGNIDLAKAHQSLALTASITGENLSTLNSLLHLDLPPFSSYKIETDLLVKKDHFEMKDLTVTVGESSLKGTALVVKGKEKTKASLEFSSPLIQVNDFIFDDWHWSSDTESLPPDKTADNGDKVTKSSGGDSAPDDNERKLLDPEILNNFDITLKIQSDKVLLGSDQLGSGLLKATVKDGRIAIKPLNLNIPGGSIELSASIKPGKENSDASLRVIMSNFDIGILARKAKPESKMGGKVNLDIDLRASAASFDQMLAHGNGYFDFSGELKNLHAGIIDLWAVNLIAAIVSSTDENQSNINCAVGRWTVDDGLLTPDVFFIDTSKIRICGKGEIDFRNDSIDMKISPSAKRAEFFNLATPLKVKGTFSDIKFGIAKGALVGTVAKFITSPLHVPVRRVISNEIPEDGSDACSVVLGMENRTKINIAGCSNH